MVDTTIILITGDNKLSAMEPDKHPFSMVDAFHL